MIGFTYLRCIKPDPKESAASGPLQAERERVDGGVRAVGLRMGGGRERRWEPTNSWE